MMKVEIKPAHRWLDKLVGEWTGKSEMDGPDGRPMPPWTETVRSLYGVWVVAETDSVMPDTGERAATRMTLGYDSRRGRYVGTWVGSMMEHMWVYDGELDEAGKALTLSAEGPDFFGGGGMARYRDVITFIDDDTRTLTSFHHNADGSWKQFMTVEYRRNK